MNTWEQLVCLFLAALALLPPAIRLRRSWCWALSGGDGGDPTIVNPARCSPRLASQICGQCHVFSVVTAWNMGWEPARQASGQAWIAPFLAELLDDDYSAIRYVAYESLRRLPGYHDFAYDFDGPPPQTCGRTVAGTGTLALPQGPAAGQRGAHPAEYQRIRAAKRRAAVDLPTRQSGHPDRRIVFPKKSCISRAESLF